MVVASFVEEEEENTTTHVSICPDMDGGPSNKENPRKIRAKRNFPLATISLFPEEEGRAARDRDQIKYIK